MLGLDFIKEENGEARGGKFPKIQIIASWKKAEGWGGSQKFRIFWVCIATISTVIMYF